MATADLLDDIIDELLDQARLVGTMMNRATESLLTVDLEMAELVIASDARVDALRAEISDKVIAHAAAHSSAATDLRIVMSAMSIAASFERMGDLAVHVAKSAKMKYPRPVVPDDLNRTIRRAGEVCCLLAQSVAVAISQRDVELAQNSFAIDDELDLIHREMFALMLGPSWNKEVGTTVDITLLSRFYERFGDHAVSVAKRLIHIVTGQSFADSVNPM